MPMLKETFDTIEGDIEVGVERLVGTFKMNGTVYNRYVKVIDCGAAPNTLSDNVYKKTVLHGISFSGVIKASAFAIHSSFSGGGTIIPFSAGTGWFYLNVTQSDVDLRASNDWSNAYTKILVTVEYYK